MERTARTLSTLTFLAVAAFALTVASAPGSAVWRWTDPQPASSTKVRPIPAPNLQLGAAASDLPALEVRNGSPEREALLEWAMGRFAEAGLPLPPLAVSFHTGRTECGGLLGSLGPDGDRYLLKTCAGGGELRQNLLHELAHAWDRAGGITPASRDEFLAMRGLDEWRGSSEWSHRGAEHAAEIVAWGLEVAEWGIPSAVAEVGPQDSEELKQAFMVLTGRSPLWEVGASARS